MAQISPSSTEGLPKHFVDAMHTLFDIMDDQNLGYVKLSDIEERWQDDGSQNMPKNVLESLKKVTPPNGLLSFERFCAGLKICLLNYHMEPNSNPTIQTQPMRPPSAPVLIAENRMKNSQNWCSPNTATIRPNNAISQQRALSMPQLLGVRKENLSRFDNGNDAKLGKMGKMGYAQQKSGRYGERVLDKSEIRTALQNWQMGLMTGEEDRRLGAKYGTEMASRDDCNAVRVGRGPGDGKDRMDQREAMVMQQNKVSNRRREPRRHTLQNGIDYNMMKRMKQIEQEKDVLIQGLAAVDKAREWYLKQISITQEKIQHLGRMGSHVEQWTEAHQERLEMQRARILEVNRHLAALISSWDRGGLPLHMNLAFLRTSSNAQLQQDTMSRIKQQNLRLTEEANKKSQRIALLEQEKDGLLRELYERQPGIVQSRRSTMIHHEQHDQTFII